ncbi:hypothetical protein HYW20_02350 [Candidatus Woesearchaeota archaeon]|nr:hypothetical protein [Candidatus Woesearchaeota archaeon]
MANYKRDKIGRQEKAYREKLKRDALKNVEPIEKKPISEEDRRRLIELWENMKKKDSQDKI